MGTKELFHYFKRDSLTPLPKSISQSAIDAINRDVSKISSSQSNETPKTRIKYIKGPSCTRDLEDFYPHVRNIQIHLNYRIPDVMISMNATT